MNIEKVILEMFAEYRHKFTAALLMEIIEEIEDIISEEFASALGIQFEDVQAKLEGAKRKIKERIESIQAENAS